MSRLDDCKEFCKLINLRDSMNWIKGSGSKEIQNVIDSLNKTINENFEHFFGDKSEYMMKYNKVHNRIVVVKVVAN